STSPPPPRSTPFPYTTLFRSLNGESFTLSYDDNGNLVSKSGPVSGTTAYTWDARNRLGQIAGPGLVASFRYDASGRRVERKVNRSEEHTSELQSRENLVCRLL